MVFQSIDGSFINARNEVLPQNQLCLSTFIVNGGSVFSLMLGDGKYSIEPGLRREENNVPLKIIDINNFQVEGVGTIDKVIEMGLHAFTLLGDKGSKFFDKYIGIYGANGEVSPDIKVKEFLAAVNDNRIVRIKHHQDENRDLIGVLVIDSEKKVTLVIIEPTVLGNLDFKQYIGNSENPNLANTADSILFANVKRLLNEEFSEIEAQGIFELRLLISQLFAPIETRRKIFEEQAGAVVRALEARKKFLRSIKFPERITLPTEEKEEKASVVKFVNGFVTEEGSQTEISKIKLCHDGKSVILTSDGNVYLYEFKKGKMVKLPFENIVSVAINPTGDMIAGYSNSEQKILAYNITNGEVIGIKDIHLDIRELSWDTPDLEYTNRDGKIFRGRLYANKNDQLYSPDIVAFETDQKQTIMWNTLVQTDKITAYRSEKAAGNKKINTPIGDIIGYTVGVSGGNDGSIYWRWIIEGYYGPIGEENVDEIINVQNPTFKLLFSNSFKESNDDVKKGLRGKVRRTSLLANSYLIDSTGKIYLINARRTVITEKGISYGENTPPKAQLQWKLNIPKGLSVISSDYFIAKNVIAVLLSDGTIEFYKMDLNSYPNYSNPVRSRKIHSFKPKVFGKHLKLSSDGRYVVLTGDNFVSSFELSID